MRVAMVLGAFLLLTGFSGCVDLLDGGGEAGDSRIVKKVVATITEDTFDDGDDSFEDVVKTTLEYTHKGGAADPSDLTVIYHTDAGKDRIVKMSEFTTKDEVRSGDVIKITGANFTSGLVVKDADDKVIAQRGGIKADWFSADGVPIPLAALRSGAAKFDITAEAGFSGSARDFDADEDVHVHSVQGSASANLEGSLDVRTAFQSGAPTVTFDDSMQAKIDVGMSARITEDGETYETGLQTRNMEGEFESKGVFKFDDDDEIAATGGSARAFFDGRVHVWDRDHPKSENYEPDDIEHPMINEDEEYDEDAWDEDGDAPPAWVVKFFNRLWSMEVGVGDDYRLNVEIDDDDYGFEFHLIVQIVGEDSRPVGGTLEQTYRVSQQSSFIIDSNRTDQAEFELDKATYWISKQSYLPVHVQSSSTRSFDRNDFNRIIEALGGDSPIEVPEEVTLAIRGEQTLRLVSYTGDFKTAPILSVLLVGPAMSSLAAGILRGVMSEVGRDSYEEAQPYALRVGFTAHETMDRMSVNSVPRDATWDRLAIRVSSCMQPGGPNEESMVLYVGQGPEPYYNEAALTTGAALNMAATGSSCGPGMERALDYSGTPIAPGDYFQLCAGPVTLMSRPSQVRLDVLDVYANEIVYQHTFSDVAKCTV